MVAKSNSLLLLLLLLVIVVVVVVVVVQARSQSFARGGGLKNICAVARKNFWPDHAHFRIITPSFDKNNDLASSCNAGYEGRESMKLSRL